MKAIKFSDVAPQVIYSHPKGYEIHIENGKIQLFKGMEKADKLYCSNYIKGLRILFKRAKEQRFFDNYNGNLLEKYHSIVNNIEKLKIALIGHKIYDIQLTGNVDGTWSINFIPYKN